MSPGRVTVSTEELQAASQILGRVDGALAQRGDLNVGAGDVGSAELSGAIADFCQKAGNLARLFSAGIGVAATTVGQAGERYEQTELSNAERFGR
jgi:hypothetical protein